MTSIGVRGMAAVFAILFVTGALVQLNDPDPALWILGYLVGAALAIAGCMGRFYFVPSVVAALVFVGWFATLAPTLSSAPEAAFTSFEMKATSHEEPREAVGLALLATWCAFAAWRSRPRSS